MARKKMNSKVKEKWLKALRSGKYKQGKGALRTSLGDQYCCLGVLCSVSGEGRWYNSSVGLKRYCVEGVSNDGTLPTPLLNKVDITQKTQTNLIKMNDSQEASFKEIANWIEKNI